MRDNHPQQTEDERVQPQRNVEKPQRNHSFGAGRHGFPRSHNHKHNQARGQKLEKPITIARHAYGDVYKGVELRTTEPGTATLTFVGQSGKTESVEVQKLDCGGVFQAMHNKDTSIKSFAHSCFRYAIDTKQDLWFSTKDTISKNTTARSSRF